MSLNELPDKLSTPVDDGAAKHLNGTRLPDIAFASTSSEIVNINRFQELTVIYIPEGD